MVKSLIVTGMDVIRKNGKALKIHLVPPYLIYCQPWTGCSTAQKNVHLVFCVFFLFVSPAEWINAIHPYSQGLFHCDWENPMIAIRV